MTISAHGKRIKRCCGGAAVLLLLTIGQTLVARPADARQARLIGKVEVRGDVVTFGDLLSDAGAHASKPVFLAPKPGTTGFVSSSRIIEAAREFGLHVAASGSDERIAIVRAGREVKADELAELIRSELEKRAPANSAGHLTVRMPEGIITALIDPSATDAVKLSKIDWSARTGAFRAEFSLAGTPLFVSGTASMMVEVSVPKLDMAEGTAITADDLEARLVASSTLGSRDIAKAKDIIGQVVKRRLRAGNPVFANDIEAPKLIRRNQIVTIVLDIPGLMIKTEGKALADGVAGETIKVMNTQSKMIINATAVSPGVVRVNGSRDPNSDS